MLIWLGTFLPPPRAHTSRLGTFPNVWTAAIGMGWFVHFSWSLAFVCVCSPNKKTFLICGPESCLWLCSGPCKMIQGVGVLSDDLAGGHEWALSLTGTSDLGRQGQVPARWR